MRRTKQRMKHFLVPLAVVACLIVCVLLTVGVAYARYRTGAMARIDFEGRRLDRLWLWELAPPSEEGEEPPQPTEPHAPQNGEWTAIDGDAYSFRFRLTNGETEQTAAEADILADVLLDIGQGFDDPWWLNVVLYTTNENNEELRYLGVPEQITEGSVLYNRFGEGWKYRFYPLTAEDTVDMHKAPLQWVFPGGEYTVREAELRITGTGVTDVQCPVRLRIVETQKEP